MRSCGGGEGLGPRMSVCALTIYICIHVFINIYIYTYVYMHYTHIRTSIIELV